MQPFLDCRAACPQRQYTLRFGFNALAAFEAVTGRPAFTAIAELERGDLALVGDLRCMCWAAMLHHHPTATLEDAGLLLDADPGCVLRALGVAMPRAEDGPEASGKKHLTGRPRFRTFFARGWKRASANVASGT